MGGYDGSIRIKALLNHSQFDRGIRSMGNAVQSLSGTLMKLAGAVGLAFGVAAIVNFGKESVRAASELSNAWMGLQSIVEGQGRSFGKAKTFVEDYVSDGLIPLTDAVTAYKNLAARGYNDEQIQKTMTALKDAAAFGRQSSYTLGQAVATASEGLKNENSILVDNAGVTKNVSKMWEDYAKSIGTTARSLTQEQKIQAEVNGILEETRFQTGDAAKLVNTYSGQVAMLGYNFQQFKVQVGNAIMPIVQAVLPGINAIISALIKLAKVFAQVTSLLFGKAVSGPSAQATANKEIASSGLAAADATDKLAGAASGAGKASKKAAKDMKGVLASFDELNILADQTSGSISGAADGIGDIGGGGEIELPTVEEGYIWEDAEISPKLLAEVEAFKDTIGRIWEVFRQSWEENGTTVIDSAKRALESLYELAKSTGRAFTEAWTGGAGLDFLNSAYQLLTTIFTIIADIADAWKTAFENSGTQFFDSILFEFAEILNLINSIGEAFHTAWNDGSGVKICETILRILTNINNVIVTIAKKIREAWEKNATGVSIWGKILDVVQTVLSFIERIAESTLKWAQNLNFEPIMNEFNNLLGVIEPLVETITDGLSAAYETVLLPLSKWVIERAAPTSVDTLSKALELLNEILKIAMKTVETLLTVFQPVFKWIGENAVKLVEKLGEQFKKVSKVFKEHGPQIEGIISGIGDILGQMWRIAEPILNNLMKLVGVVFDFWGTTAATNLGIVLGELEGLIDFVAGVFTGDWRRAWQGIKQAFLTPINAIISKIQDIIALAKNAVSALLDLDNAPKSKAGKQVISGKKTINSRLLSYDSISEFSINSIPRLANGAVIPPNQQFAAILGDQRSGKNLEAPAGLIRQMVSEGIQTAMNGMTGINQPVQVNVMLDRKVLARAMVTEVNDMTRSAGKPVLLF